MKPLLALTLLLGGSLLRAAAAAALAADDAVSPPGLDEIIVSAEKRQMNLESAPLAITVVSGAALDRSNIAQLADLGESVPSLTIARSSGFERIITIRGIGSETPENAYTTQPSVSFHIDGVYIGNTISLDQSLFGVEQIEISRGPQATVFGQTSTGGTINLISKQPQLARYDAYVDVSGGSYDLWRGRGMFNLPLGDTLAVRASVQALATKASPKTPRFRAFASMPPSSRCRAATGVIHWLSATCSTSPASTHAIPIPTGPGRRATNSYHRGRSSARLPIVFRYEQCCLVYGRIHVPLN